MDLLSYIPQFGNLIFTIGSFVVALTVIVFVHEYGHYIVGRWSGIQADVFSIGFGPVLWSRMDKHGTRWQVAALPFGGYVKFRGDADAASGKDEDAMAEAAADPEELRKTMHGAPLWARTATVAAGPVFNFVLAILVFGGIFMARGAPSDPLTVGMIPPLPAGAYELREGDEILAIGGHEIPPLDETGRRAAFFGELPQQPVLEYRIRRDGAERTVNGPYLYPPLAGQVVPGSASIAAGFVAGDVILEIEEREIFAFGQLKETVEGSNGRPLPMKVWRAGEVMDLVLTPRRMDEPQPEGGFKTQWRIGIVSGMAFEPATRAVTFTEALSGGAAQTWRVIEGSVSGLWHILTGAISSCNMSGAIKIAQTSGETASQGGASFIWFIALLSAAIGMINLFPIPVLDGGHLLFYAYEAVTGRPPSDAVLRVLMTIGLTLVLGLMIFALANDVLC